MPQRTIDLAAHINRTVARGGPADFPVSLKPIAYRAGGAYARVPRRLAVVRDDTGEALAVVSERYRLVPHVRVLSAIERAIDGMDVGDVPRGVFLDRRGARMRALYKFPALKEALNADDRICPCVRIQNTYDGTGRIAVQIGAFRFVCTNLAVGGGGAFAGGFMATHAGDVAVEAAAAELAGYLAGFGRIVRTYRVWSDAPLDAKEFAELLEPLPKRTRRGIAEGAQRPRTVFDAYNAATRFATHEMRSHRSAFELLEWVNRSFQEAFPPLAV